MVVSALNMFRLFFLSLFSKLYNTITIYKTFKLYSVIGNLDLRYAGGFV
jgi:hypothetical protein